MAGGMAAQHDFGAGRSFQTQALGPDGNPAIGADLDGGAQAPHIGPPRAGGDRSQRRTVFLAGLVPGPLRGLAQFPVEFVGIVVCAQLVDMRIGDGEFADVFAGEISGEPALPVKVFAFDFALGLGGGGVTQADVIELEGPAQLGEGVGILGEEEAVVIDIQLQGPAMGPERGREKVEIGEEEFALIKFGAGEKAAAIVQHVEHGEEAVDGGKPAVGGGVQLPQLANAGTLPAADGG